MRQSCGSVPLQISFSSKAAGCSRAREHWGMGPHVTKTHGGQSTRDSEPRMSKVRVFMKSSGKALEKRSPDKRFQQEEGGAHRVWVRGMGFPGREEAAHAL